MSNLAQFSFENHEIRTTTINESIWFVATDVAKALGYSSPKDAASHLDADEKGSTLIRTPGGDQSVTIINESGLYALVLRSRKPEARKFAKWITTEVLPAIRKTGKYIAAPATVKPLPPLEETDSITQLETCLGTVITSLDKRARDAGLPVGDLQDRLVMVHRALMKKRIPTVCTLPGGGRYLVIADDTGTRVYDASGKVLLDLELYNALRRDTRALRAAMQEWCSRAHIVDGECSPKRLEQPLLIQFAGGHAV